MSHSRGHAERRRRRTAAKRKQNRAARAPGIWGRRKAAVTDDAYRHAVEALTNRQRSAWGRAKYPGNGIDRDATKVAPFAAL